MNDESELDVVQWVKRWKQGDQQAAEALFDRYATMLIRLASDNLKSNLKRRVSGEDVVQSVFRSFFDRTANQGIHVDSSRKLWNLLVTMTLARTRSVARHHQALKRNVAAEFADVNDGWRRRELASGPGPAEAAIFVESVEQITGDLSAKHKAIVAMRMAGQSRTEIAEWTGLSRQTVYRVLKLIEDRVNQLLD